MARDSVSISIEPTVAPPKHPVKARQTKDRIEGPPPPDSSCHVKVRIGARLQFSTPSQDLYVVQQMFLRNLQAAVPSGRLQVFQGEASPSNDLFPEMNPSIAEPAPAIVEYPTLARQSGLRFVVGESHRILLPVNTMTGEPSATNAQSGRRLRIVASSGP